MPQAKVIAMPGAMSPVQREMKPRDDVMAMPFEEVVRLTGGSAANGDNSDPIVLQGGALQCAQEWLERFGFDRLPATYGELMGMYDYCMELEVLSGFDSVAPELLSQWQDAHLKVQAQYDPDKLEPLQLYIKQDIVALRAYHVANDTLTKLGRNYDEFSHEFVEDDSE